MSEVFEDDEDQYFDDGLCDFCLQEFCPHGLCLNCDGCEPCEDENRTGYS